VTVTILQFSITCAESLITFVLTAATLVIIFQGFSNHFPGWGCGYRNIQMLTSYLIRFLEYKKILFGGTGYVPSIPVIQEYIEKAWSKGFDLQGASQLGNSLQNSKKMIGTTECAALLRSFGVK
jgi:hypothetical protein